MKNNTAQKNIPQGWTLKRLGDVLDYERPDNYIVKSTSYANDRKTPVLTANKSFVLGYTDEDFGIYENLPCVIFDDFTTDSKFVDFSFKVKSSAIKILKSKDENVDLKFVHERMKLIKFPLGNHKRYYISQYQDLEILIPESKTEQQKIAEILGAVDEDIAKTQGVIEATEKLKKGLMQQLFTRGIGHTKFKKTKLGEIPEEWEIISLQEMIDNGIVVSHLDGNHGELYPKTSEFIDDGVPYLSANCIEDGNVNFHKAKYLSSERASKFIKGVAMDGDMLFAHNATVGPVAILKTKEKYVILSTTLTYYRCNEDKLVTEYVRYYMESDLFSDQYKRVMAQSTRNQVPITMQRTFLHVLPIYKEQQKIAEILSAVDEKISINKKLKNKLTLLKKGLMQDLLSGKVRV